MPDSLNPIAMVRIKKFENSHGYHHDPGVDVAIYVHSPNIHQLADLDTTNVKKCTTLPYNTICYLPEESQKSHIKIFINDKRKRCPKMICLILGSLHSHF